jgi:hypothetical protein
VPAICGQRGLVLTEAGFFLKREGRSILEAAASLASQV